MDNGKMKNILEKNVYAIPLGMLDISDATSLAKQKTQDMSSDFAYCAVVRNETSVGLKIVISSEVNGWKDSVEASIFDSLLMEPLVTSGLAIQKKRWRKVDCKGELCLSDYNEEILTPVTVWRGSQIEKKIMKIVGLKSD
ncbi:hypothetical protein MPV89_001340 [Vibrio vulnificus]|uniref:hypothetical protein n=1 Tax=Vibrio TaxID=662 RepID=UPI0005F16401|nr:hypothetical protein [Vibrio vulnificus]EGR1513481.1 hypothetical protein [Vibrio vulnificus]EHH2451557.1 hypothetical protein [Vibrio vulnificus]EIZ4667213.1 hypothetical protein [Vibrio vulnificus]EJC6743003.1 hypothetical protein [Vibrio vulnificus]EJC6818234.1 hypothetical protein [Vibrio vulnificus]